MTMEFIIGIVIVVILGIFLNPSHLLMPDSLNTMLILALIIGFLGFISLIWREQAKDERDGAHIQKSGRLGFLIGSSVLVVGVVVQALDHNIDPWLLYSLLGMVLTKIASRIFHHFKN